MFGRLDFKEKEKKWEKMMRENFLKGVWLIGGEEKMIMGPWYFLPKPTKKFSSQNIYGENLVGEIRWLNTHVQVADGLQNIASFLFILFSFFSLLFYWALASSLIFSSLLFFFLFNFPRTLPLYFFPFFFWFLGAVTWCLICLFVFFFV